MFTLRNFYDDWWVGRGCCYLVHRALNKWKNCAKKLKSAFLKKFLYSASFDFFFKKILLLAFWKQTVLTPCTFFQILKHCVVPTGVITMNERYESCLIRRVVVQQLRSSSEWVVVVLFGQLQTTGRMKTRPHERKFGVRPSSCLLPILYCICATVVLVAAAFVVS